MLRMQFSFSPESAHDQMSCCLWSGYYQMSWWILTGDQLAQEDVTYQFNHPDPILLFTKTIHAAFVDNTNIDLV